MCVPRAGVIAVSAGGQTQSDPYGVQFCWFSVPPPTACLPVGRGRTCKVSVCWRMLSVSGSHRCLGLMSNDSWTARPRVAMILRDVARRFSVRFSTSSPGAIGGLCLPAESDHPGAFASAAFPVSGIAAFKLSQCVGILLPLRLLAGEKSGRRQTADHAGI